VQLPQAFLQSEPGIHCGEHFRADCQGGGFVLVVENPQPRHPSLTNLALAVVENSILGSYVWVICYVNDLGYGVLGHGDCSGYALVSASFQAPPPNRRPIGSSVIGVNFTRVEDFFR
jgi:hypothetical protein